MGMEASPQEQTQQARPRDCSRELGVITASAAGLASLPESIARAVGLGEQGISPNLLEVFNKHAFVVIFS